MQNEEKYLFTWQHKEEQESSLMDKYVLQNHRRMK